MSEDGSQRGRGFFYVRMWMALFLVGCVAELVTGLVLYERLPWPPSLYGPAVFASVWTGLAVAQNRRNSPHSR